MKKVEFSAMSKWKTGWWIPPIEMTDSTCYEIHYYLDNWVDSSPYVAWKSLNNAPTSPTPCCSVRCCVRNNGLSGAISIRDRYYPCQEKRHSEYGHGMSRWWPLMALLSWYTITQSSHCHSFDNVSPGLLKKKFMPKSILTRILHLWTGGTAASQSEAMLENACHLT